ncbi:MAG: outer membrane beta-barrel protein [Muribaculaceae bacterium]|nr:outer membrane beta-barrel protein [Muribaculaceae bacterium]
MKKILILAALFTAAVATHAAPRGTEIGVSYGAFPAMQSIGAYNGNWDGINPWGAVNITIDHTFAPRLKLGLSYTLSSASTANATTLTPAGRATAAGGDITWHALMVNARYDWLSRPRWRMYSTAAAGVLVSYYSPGWRDSYNNTRLGFQVSPVGFEVDLAPAVGLFAEAGYGVQGILQAGLRIGF